MVLITIMMTMMKFTKTKVEHMLYNIIAVEQQHWLWGGVWANNGNDKMDNNSNGYHMYLK